MSEPNRNKRSRLLNILIIIGVVVLIILTIGWIINETEKQNAIKGPDEDDKKLPDLEEVKKKLKLRLSEVEARIKFIENRKIEIITKEKKILIAARLIIGLKLLALNGLFLYFFNWPFKLDAQLNINGAILLVYSFLAFITYGTPTRFINALKSKIAYYLKKKHIDIIEELEPLRLERDRLIKEIDLLENDDKE